MEHNTPNKEPGDNHSVKPLPIMPKTTPGYEPSPASTYGETMAGGSSPITPFDDAQRDSSPKTTRSFNALNLNNRSSPGGSIRSIPGHRFSDSSHNITVPSSPSNHARARGSTSASLSFIDSPTQLLEWRSRKNANISPTELEWRRSVKITESGRENQQDDPFMSPSHGSRQRLAAAHESTPNCRRIFVPCPSETAGLSSSDSKINNNQDEATLRGPIFSPREDRAKQQASSENAQGLFPPDACVFVANLASSKTDDQLEHSVRDVFSQYGNVYVKIRRDQAGMPYAFCQYEKAEDAKLAINEGRGIVIDGRPCRTEHAKAPRAVYLTRVTGGPITEREARDVLELYGAIEEVWHPSPTDSVIYRLPEGIMIRFHYFQDCRDAQAALRDNQTWRLEAPQVPAEHAMWKARRVSESPFFSRLAARRNQTNSHQLTIPPARDRPNFREGLSRHNWVTVNHVPENVNETGVAAIFGMFGTIADIEIQSESNETGMNLANIEYETYEAARLAIQENHPEYWGHPIRVSPRPIHGFQATRGRQELSSGSPNGQPCAQPSISHLDQGSRVSMTRRRIYSHLMSRAYTLGLSREEALAILDLEATYNYPPRSFYGGPTGAYAQLQYVPSMNYWGNGAISTTQNNVGMITSTNVQPQHAYHPGQSYIQSSQGSRPSGGNHLSMVARRLAAHHMAQATANVSAQNAQQSQTANTYLSSLYLPSPNIAPGSNGLYIPSVSLDPTQTLNAFTFQQNNQNQQNPAQNPPHILNADESSKL
ncbi:MAG: hypothetical protein M1834_003453 [Cirrosporium novae-zelandiae]|nr:MAG: hypothetical protein M1834_003453 [Cirrosporium novae-zelandiae]